MAVFSSASSFGPDSYMALKDAREVHPVSIVTFMKASDLRQAAFEHLEKQRPHNLLLNATVPSAWEIS